MPNQNTKYQSESHLEKLERSFNPIKISRFWQDQIPVLAKFYSNDRISITFLYNANFARPYNFSYLQVFPI